MAFVGVFSCVVEGLWVAYDFVYKRKYIELPISKPKDNKIVTSNGYVKN